MGRMIRDDRINRPIRETFKGRDTDPHGHAVEDLIYFYANASTSEDTQVAAGQPDHKHENARGLWMRGFRPKPRLRRSGQAPFSPGDFPHLGRAVGRFLCLNEQSIPPRRCHRMDYDLLPGETITFFTSKRGHCYSGGKYGVPPYYANGVLTTPLSALGPEGGRRLPYPITDISLRRAGRAGLTSAPATPATDPTQPTLKVSFDAGLTWLAITDRDSIRVALASVATYAFWIRRPSGTSTDETAQLVTEFQVAPLSLPRLKRGANLIRWLASEQSLHPIAIGVDIAYTVEAMP